jgi:NAD(P)-dependent dehydrogenase (short-subunit alcohol dehydrogenase family)
MMELEGKVAVVTGGASGIGRATGAALAARGMHVVLADVEQAVLDRTVEELATEDLDVSGVVTDVTQFDSVQSLHDTVVDRYGTVHVAMFNAGISARAPVRMWERDLNDWAWALAVNTWGLIHGLHAFVPTMVANGEDGHVIATSSSVGVVAPVPSAPIYSMTKATVLTICECLHADLRAIDSSVRASVLVPPGTIHTALFSSTRNRPERFQPTLPGQDVPQLSYDQVLARMNDAGNERVPVEPEEVAEYVLEALASGSFWIMPGPRHAVIQQQFDDIIRARAEAMVRRLDPMTYLQKARQN